MNNTHYIRLDLTALINTLIEESQPTCPICLGELSENPTTLKCKHVFDAHCIAEWLANPRHPCPICRDPQERIQPITFSGVKKAISALANGGLDFWGLLLFGMQNPNPQVDQAG